MARNRILIVDDEPGIRFGIRNFLDAHGFDATEAEDCKSALELFRSAPSDIVLVDYSLPDGNALELLPKLKEINASLPVVVLTGHGSIDLAVRAIKEGAEQFITKPVELPALLVVLQRVLENQRSRRKEMAGKSRQSRREINPFIGSSQLIRQVEEEAKKVAGTESPVLIQGETGAGKSVLAAWLHQHSTRADEAFVDLNCAGLSREFLETELFGHEKGAFTGAVAAKNGLLEVAHKGTVFLDEIGDVDMQVQPKLLKVLEEKRFRRLGEVRDRVVDIRLIAATHQNLRNMVSEKRFREDLFFRINTLPLRVPALRERPEDIPLLAEHMLEELSLSRGRDECQLSGEAADAIRRYPWPGNIRELRNVLERAVLLGDKNILQPQDLKLEAAAAMSPLEAVPSSGDNNGAYSSNLTLEEVERRHIELVLREEKGKVEAAAKRLGIPRSSLYNMVKRYQIPLSRL
jgi:DNA-binding NtrC family response regulator